MSRKLDGSLIQSGTITTTQLSTVVVNNISAGGGPKVTTITYPNNATAAANTGNESVTLTGTGFESGVQVYINGSAAPAVSRTNANSLSFTTPALSTGATYPLYVVNPDGGTAVVVPGMVVSAGPIWVTNTQLTPWGASSALSTTLVATSDSTVSYALDDGSSLPGGLSLAANGLLSGTLSSPPEQETTYNFTVIATDLELQKSSKAFSINATVGISATGGTVSNISGYRIHTFTSSGTLEVTGTGTVEYLVVAGGGGGAGGGWRVAGGGGGAGGLRTGTGFSLTPGSYAITVGAGGAGGDGQSIPSTSGSNSIFSTITSNGGGFGGRDSPGAGGSGGSGGGSTGSVAGGAGNTPSTSPSQGNNGGAGSGSLGVNNCGSGGGGGAGGVGGNSPSSSVAGTAGPGASSSITGSSVTYAAGGAGAVDTATNNGTAGANNTGNGGGGGGGIEQQQYRNGGAGGSGIVIIRYAA